MKSKNRVVSGHHCGEKIVNYGEMLVISKPTYNITLSQRTIEEYRIVSQKSEKSTSSVVKRGLLGGALLGGVGALAGSLSAKDEGINVVAIKFKDGKKCVIEIDDIMLGVLVNCLF